MPIPSKVQTTRYHDFSAGHRVAGHESKCANLHGHNYRVHFTVQAENLDSVGRVLDFSAIKENLCEWLETFWDHKFLIWEKDEYKTDLTHLWGNFGVRIVPFNPTAENMAIYLVTVVGPENLKGTGVTLVKVVVEETRKCSASYEIGGKF
jgi:6-pyruvoyltetrahydropterin/6-carboxytetrahydropterin synthase